METERSNLSGVSAIRSVEKSLEEAQHTGVLDLSGRQLNDYPYSKYELTDTIEIDLSRNQLSELPHELYTYHCLEHLNCYGNTIRYIPDNIADLQNLLVLNLSRNQLSFLPSAVCQLKLLEVLRVASNRLVSLPEEIGDLQRLTELDVSCNELSQLPSQIAELNHLHCLNVRRNRLIDLPAGFSSLQVQHLDISSNVISHLPVELHAMDSLHYLRIDGNPLVMPPASICEKGLKHILKYLSLEKSRECRTASHSREDVRLPFSSADRSVINGQNYNLESSLNHYPGTQKLGGIIKTDHSVIISQVRPTSVSLNELTSTDRVVDTRNGKKLVAVEGHHNNNNGDNRSYKQYDNDFQQPDFLIRRERNGNSFRKSSSVDMLANESGSDAERVDVTNADLKLPKLPSQARDSLFEHILIEYNHSPRKGWETTEMDNETDRLVNEQRAVHQKDISNNSSDGEIETEILQPRVTPFSTSSHSLNLSPSASLNGDIMSGEKEREMVSRANLIRSHSGDYEFRCRQSEIVAVQRREAHKIYRRLSREKEHKLQQNADNPQMVDSSHEVDGALSDDGLELLNFNPLLTVRRQYRSLDERSDSVKNLRKMIQDELKIVLPMDTAAALSDGVLLCQLVNEIYPHLIPGIYVPSQGSLRLSSAKRQKNVDKFLSACQRLKIPESLICSPSAVLEGSCIEDVATTVQALLACGAHFRQSAV